METSTVSETIDIQERTVGTRCCAPGSEPRLSSEDAEQLTSDLQILANPVRLQILNILARQEGQVCVCDIEDAVPVKQPTVSHHLRLLREAGLIAVERKGLWAYYFLNHDVLKALRARVTAHLGALV